MPIDRDDLANDNADYGIAPELKVISEEEARATKAKTVKWFVLLAFVHFAIATSVAILLFRPSSPLEQTSYSVPDFEVDRYVRNLSWSTGFLESTPYRKGDELEVRYFADSKFPAYLPSFDFSKIGNDFEILSVSEGDSTGTVDMANPVARSGRTSFLVKIRAKNSGVTEGKLPDLAIRESKEGVRDPKAVEGTGVSNTATGTSLPKTSAGKFSLEKTSFSSDSNEVVTVNGPMADEVEHAVVGGKDFKGFSSGGAYRFVVDRATFAEGEYFVALYLKNGTLVPVDGKLSFYMDSSSVGVSSVVPDSVTSKRDSYVVIQGRWLSKVVSLQLSNSVVIRSAGYSALSDLVAIVKIPAGLPPGNYAFNVMDVWGISSPKRAIITVTK